MMHFELGDVIANRQLRFKRVDGTLVDVAVLLGKPVPDPRDPHRAQMCPYRIHGIGDEKTRAIFGIDAMQALILAMHILPTELAAIARENGGSFVGGEPDLGLTHACQIQMQGFEPNKPLQSTRRKTPRG